MCQEKQKDPVGTVKIILKKNKAERLTGPNFKTYYKGYNSQDIMIFVK